MTPPEPPKVPTFLPPQRGPHLTFDSAEALARHVHAVRAGRRLELLEQAATIDGCELFPVVALFVRTEGGETWLGWCAGPGMERIGEVIAALQATRPARPTPPPQSSATPPLPAAATSPADLFNDTKAA